MPILPTVPLSYLGIFATGMGGAQVVSWFLHRNAERVTSRASGAQADASEAGAALTRMDLINKLSDRMARLEQQNETLRAQQDAREASHREDISRRDKLIASQQLLLAQQQTEIDGLKQQLALLRHDLEQWRVAAREGRDALRETLLAATSPQTPTPTPTPPSSSGAGDERP